MQQLERFSTLLHTIYEGAINPAAWPGVVTAVTEWLDAEKGILLTPYQVLDQGGFAFTHRIPQSSIEKWSTRYAPENPWAIGLEAQGLMNTGVVKYGSELIPDAEMLTSQWYRALLAPDDIFNLLLGLAFGKGHPGLPVCFLGIFRGLNATPFNEEYRQRMHLLLPHVSRALGVMFRLRDSEFRVAASLNALNKIRTGILLLDQEGRVCFVNSAAEKIFQQQDGLRLKASARSLSTLHADDPRAQSSLDKALRSTVHLDLNHTQYFAHASGVARLSGLPDYTVQVSCLPESNPYQLGHVIPRAIVFIRDGSQLGMPEAALLIRTYGLTQAEARLALALCDGGSLESVAQELQVGVNTLKTHLKNTYAKTSLNSRAALTKLLLSLGSD